MTRFASSAPLRIAACCCLLAAGSAAAAADFQASATGSSGNINVSGPTDEVFRQDSVAVQASASSTSTERNEASDSSGLATSAASAWSTSAAGGMRLLTQASTRMISTHGGAAGGQATGSADTSMRDSFVVLADGCIVAACATGAIGTMTFSVRFDAGFDGGGNYRSSTPDGGNGGWSVLGEWNASGFLGSGIDGAEWFRGAYSALDQRGEPLVTSTGGGAGLGTFTTTFEFGMPISLFMRAHAVSQSGVKFDYYASQDGDGGSSADAGYTTDMSHTIAWNGISEVRDADGAPISGFGAVSADTGYDYARAFAAPVPEPHSWALMAAGLAALRLYRRRVGRSG